MIRRLLLAGAWIVATLGGHAIAADPAQAGLRSERIAVEQGLPDQRVYTLAQDRDGMIWIGSRGGLFRFDGYRFDVIDDNRPHRFGDRPLLDNNVGRVFVDSRNRLWAMSWGAGLNRLDLDRGRMQHYLPDPADGNSLSSPFAQIVFEDRDGTLWIGAANGLNRFDEATGGFELVRAGARSDKPIDDARVWSLIQHPDGALWIGTAGGLYRYDPATPQLPPRAIAAEALAQQTVRALHWDRRGRLWLATATAFGRLDLEQERFLPVELPPSAGLPSVRVSDLWAADGDLLWLATEAGLMQVDLAGGRYLEWPGSKGLRLFAGDDFRDVLIDRGGVIWLSSAEQGIVKLRGASEAVRLINPLPADVAEPHGYGQVNASLVDRNGRVWLATPRGLLRGDAAHWRFERASARYGNPQLELPYLALAEAADGQLWLAGTDGVRRLSPDTGATEDFGEAMRALGAVDVRSNAVIEDRQGRVWIGSHRHGLFRIGTDGAMVRFAHDPQRPDSISSDLIGRLLEDRLGRLWIGMQTGGLNLIVPGEERVVVYQRDPRRPGDASARIDRSEITAIYHARDGRLWVGGPGGIDLLSLSSGRFEPVAVPRVGGPLVVADFFEDDSGNVWGVFADQVARLPADAPGAGMRRFEDHSGHPFLFREGTGSSLADGTRLLGGQSGLLALRVDRFSGDAPQAETNITRVMLENDALRLSRGAAGIPEVVLGPGSGSLSIEFALADFRSPRLNRFRYRVRGLDGDYVDVGAERSARYSHLPPGEHLFEVEGSGPEGVWSREPARLRVRVLPPWWKDPRVLGGLALLAAAFAVVGFRLHLYRVAARHTALQRVIDSRTRALLRQREELESMDQMVRAINRHVTPDGVLREALSQGLALLPAGVRGAALLREPAGRQLVVVAMAGYTLVEQEGRFRDDRIDPDLLVRHGDELGRGLYLLRSRQQQSRIGARRLPLATLVLIIELDGMVGGALVIDHYGNPLAFDETDLPALLRYREHLSGALANARLMQQLAASRVQQQSIEDAAERGAITDALARAWSAPLRTADAAAQELEIDLAQLERKLATEADDARTLLGDARRHLQRMTGGVAELRELIRRLRQSSTAAPLAEVHPVALLASSLRRLRDTHGARMQIDSRLAVDPPLPGIEGALQFAFDVLLEHCVGNATDTTGRLMVAAGIEAEGLLIDLHADGAQATSMPAAALDLALARSVIERHGGQLRPADAADTRGWRIVLPLSRADSTADSAPPAGRGAG
jgi:ligand-binding sensor domain-containing protein